MTLHPDIDLPTPEEFEQLSPEQLAARMNGSESQGLSGTLGQKLGLRLLSVTKDKLVARMPVEGNRQPAGRLHGGASLALAEELASVGSWINLDVTREVAVGVDLSGTHVRGVTGGYVMATATLAYRGRSVMVWEIEVQDERGKTTTLARCTCNVVRL
ncbi:PaaI family thioesterase [Deinococcus radiophilus]|uniref:PaaI family thioesterase n=1 Tax=Deinococcus radiophilus TaxID=32062 RepID=A0A3S0JMR4_9DEIO|nr:PaaI family thioesterase [Deinococcus radiophilus]RTR25252.1 PaaI family thioesterase [Deinococcus radiophilus]UFA50275.1 PaaI family thioesterase [Deinococcus radiophilus]